MIFFTFQLFNYYFFLWCPVLQLNINTSLKKKSLPNIISSFQGFLTSPWADLQPKPVVTLNFMFSKFATIAHNKLLLTQLLPALAHLEVIASSLPAAACQFFPSCIEGEHCWSCFHVWWSLSLPPNGSKAEEGKKKR